MVPWFNVVPQASIQGPVASEAGRGVDVGLGSSRAVG
ncbi:MAG: hypothetical protein RL318_1618, partial [Fibrobacterota bacterium]